MTNFQKAKEIFDLEMDRGNFCQAIHRLKGEGFCLGKCKKCRNWLRQEYKEAVLDELEKEYLLNIIKPFYQKVLSIVKLNDIQNKNKEYISIIVEEYNDTKCEITFPYFDKNTMYKNMKRSKKYTLKELGL